MRQVQGRDAAKPEAQNAATEFVIDGPPVSRKAASIREKDSGCEEYRQLRCPPEPRHASIGA